MHKLINSKKNRMYKDAWIRFINNRFTTDDLDLIQKSVNNDSNLDGFHEALDRLSDEMLINMLSHTEEQKEIYRKEAAQCIIECECNNRIRSQNVLLRHIKYRRHKIKIWYASAAIFLLGILLPLTYILLTNGDKKNKTIQYVEVVTQYGEIKTIVLPDQTKVTLNAKSKIAYPKIFAKNVREVKLSGEAYFNVKRNEKQNFVVSSDNLKVCVLGTQFVVTDYPNDQIAETILVSGKIRIHTSKDIGENQFELSPNERLLFDPKKQTSSIQNINALQYITWINGKLTFDDTNINTVINRLGQWYGIEIEYPAELDKKYRLTFTIRDETFDQVMQLIQTLISVRFVQLEKNRYIIEETEE